MIIGCCSKYKECSQEGKCISQIEEIKTACYYRKNLEEGLNFYSSNRTTIERFKPDRRLYIVVNNRCFIVRKRHPKTGLSYKLKNEDIEIIENEFNEAGVNYKYNVEESECIIEGATDEDPTRSTSQVAIKIKEHEYNILNFNTWLIKVRASNQIAEYLSDKGIEANVINKGYNSNIRKFQPRVRQKKKKKEVKQEYEQLCLF